MTRGQRNRLGPHHQNSCGFSFTGHRLSSHLEIVNRINIQIVDGRICHRSIFPLGEPFAVWVGKIITVSYDVGDDDSILVGRFFPSQFYRSRGD